jgi:Rieske Fe-S protein
MKTSENRDARRLVNRRQFLAVSSGCVLCAALGRAAEKSKKKREPVEIGSLKSFSKDGINEEFAATNDFFVIRYRDRLFAASTSCPHVGHTLNRDPDDPTRIICGSHHSVFDAEGVVMVGPAATGLVRLGISVNDKGNVVVDPNKEFPQAKWTEKGSYIEVE